MLRGTCTYRNTYSGKPNGTQSKLKPPVTSIKISGSIFVNERYRETEGNGGQIPRRSGLEAIPQH